MLKQSINIAMLIGIAFLDLSCGHTNNQQADLEQCQNQCQERLDSPDCRIGGPNICLCHCELRQGKSLPADENIRLAENKVRSIGPKFLINNQLIYSGLRTQAPITDKNGTKIASSVWVAAGTANEVTIQNNGNGGFPDYPDLSLDISLQDSSSGETYLFEDYHLSLHPWPEYTDINIIGGKFYDPKYGYVDVSTTVPLRIYDSDAGPSSGVLVATGEDDSTLTMSAFSDAVYQVVVERKQQ